MGFHWKAQILLKLQQRDDVNSELNRETNFSKCGEDKIKIARKNKNPNVTFQCRV